MGVKRPKAKLGQNLEWQPWFGQAGIHLPPRCAAQDTLGTFAPSEQEKFQFDESWNIPPAIKTPEERHWIEAEFAARLAILSHEWCKPPPLFYVKFETPPAIMAAVRVLDTASTPFVKFEEPVNDTDLVGRSSLGLNLPQYRLPCFHTPPVTPNNERLAITQRQKTVEEPGLAMRANKQPWEHGSREITISRFMNGKIIEEEGERFYIQLIDHNNRLVEDRVPKEKFSHFPFVCEVGDLFTFVVYTLDKNQTAAGFWPHYNFWHPDLLESIRGK